MPNNDKFKDYTRYAEHCLNMVAGTTDQELRRIQREMASEWLNSRMQFGPHLSPGKYGLLSHGKCKWNDCRPRQLSASSSSAIARLYLDQLRPPRR